MIPAEFIQGYLENSLSEAEADALRQWLAEDPSHVDKLALETLIHSQLCEMLGERRVREHIQARAAPEHQAKSPLPLVEPYVPSGGFPLKSRSPVLGFLHNALRIGGDTPAVNAAMLLFVTFCTGMLLTMFVTIGLILHRLNTKGNAPEVAVDGGKQNLPSNPQSPIPNPSPVACLTRAAECRWAANSNAPKPGDGLVPGRKLVLESGLAEIVFQNGAHSVLEGPATLEIGSRSAAYLQQGRCTVTVATPLARGFEIHTPRMKFTDLGTEFGVFVAANGEQEVHVFRGKVEAEESGGRGAGGVERGAQSVEQNLPSPSGRGAGGEGGRVKDISNPQSPIPLFPPPHSLTLTAGQALRIPSPGKPAERIAADATQFVRTGQMAAKVAESEAKASQAANIIWKEIGAAPGVVGMAAVGGKLFAVTADKKLQLCDPSAATVEWKPIGDAPGGVVAMGLAEGRLCVSLNARAAGRFLKRDAVETNAAWQDDGHAWCLVGIAGVPGKVYALMDTKEPGSEVGMMVRDSLATPEVLAKLPPAARGLDGLPWTATDRRPPVGALAMTTVGGKFYVATKEDKLFVGDTNKSDVKWQPAGDAAGVTCLAGGNGKLFAATKDGKLLMGEGK
ncbi:MAG: FecR domain-containing protein [Planctomycetota bacterium]